MHLHRSGHCSCFPPPIPGFLSRGQVLPLFSWTTVLATSAFVTLLPPICLSRPTFPSLLLMFFFGSDYLLSLCVVHFFNQIR